MNIAEAFALVGVDKIKWQTLDESVTDSARIVKSGGTKFSFLTGEVGPEYLLGGHDKICLITWLPRKAFEAVIAEARKAQANT